MNYIKTTILLASLTALLVFCGDALGGRQGAIIGLVFAAVINFGSYWYSDKIILRIYKAREVSEETDSQLVIIVRNLAASAELPMPKVYVMDNPVPNAFATGRNPAHAAVAVTTGLRDLLTIDELIGVMAHELSHVKNRDILISTVAATIAGAISYMAQMAMWASMFGGRDNRGTHPAVLIFMMILAPIAAMVIQMAVSRSREYAADRGGALMAGSPLYLAEALKKLEYYNKKAPLQKVNDATAHLFIVSPLGGRGTKGSTMRKLFSTHP
ncbi:MAG: zinc metalloprotease HtpX, partial [Deltaproteobacteria bacterium]|nr:zinc metalloprotease HtpX [Deltaproteobacteria bacterium]